MATLKHLQIAGIRSFGADDLDRQYISFDKPFNLILGRNGCGKTTIIEALKYACTGTMPPGQGANFVRDPKLDRVVETRAQVKLKFVTCQGKIIHVCKLMSSTQKVKTVQFKTVGVVTSVEDEQGKISQLSSRHNDAEALVCRLLGVSKPILNYVIFCHQEESYWPLDESKRLKEKFDEIFDSTKYNKCMDAVRTCRKNVMEELRVDREVIKELQQNVSIVIQKKGELEEFIKRLNESENQIKKHEDDIKGFKRDREIWYKKHEDYSRLVQKRDSANNQLEKLNNQQALLKKMITYVFTGTIEELNVKILEFNNQLHQKEDALNKIETERKIVDHKEENLQRSLSENTIKIGNLQAEKQHVQKTEKERNAKLSKVAKNAGLPTLKAEPSDDEVTNLVTIVKKYLLSLVSSINTLKVNQERKEKTLQGNINKCLEAKTNLEAEIRMKEDAVSANEAEIKIMVEKIDAVNVHRSKKQEIDQAVSKCRQDREKAQLAEDPGALSSDIQELETACQELEDQYNGLSSEARTLMSFQVVQNKMKITEEKLKELQVTLNRLQSKNRGFVSKHLEHSTDNTLKLDFEALLRKWKSDIDELRNDINRKTCKETSLEEKRRHLKAQLDKKKGELVKNKESLYQLCGKRPIDDVLKGVEADMNCEQTNKGVLDASSVVFSNYISKLREPTPCCPLCNRGFDDELEVTSLIQEIIGKKSNLPVNINKHNTAILKLQEKQRNLLAMKPVEEFTRELETNEIPELEKLLSDIEENLEIAKQEIPLLEASMQALQIDLKNAEDIQGDIIETDRCQKEYKKLLLQVEKYKQELPSNNSTRSLDQALEEQQSVQQKLSTKRKEKDEAEKRLRVYEKRINEVDQRLNALVSKQLTIDKLVHEEESIKTRLNEVTALKTVLESELSELKERLPLSLDKKTQAEDALKFAKEEHSKILQIKEKEKGDIEKEMITISDFHKSLSDFQAKNIDETLLRLEQKHGKLENELENLKTQRKNLSEKSNELKALVDGHERNRKELEENLTLIKVEEQIAMQKEVCDKIKEEVGDIDFLGIQNKCIEIDKKLSRSIRQMDELSGHLKGIQENVSSRQRELNIGHYKNAELKHKQKLVELTVREHVEKDLQKYYSAIDFAMQRYHREQMNCINKIIRELWKLIYKGNDIDHIEIETDESATTANATVATEKRKTYNYRVVQVKNGTKIEMRGRCSAGQKVLACLIIRMALSETFSTNCGILTLDEPTTNLDKENIKSLCIAISEIVNSRDVRKGFQLIVITHDLQFLKAMSHVDAFEHYWEVSRNHQSKSQIRMKNVVKE